jgi:hypothetical protein
MVFGRIRMSRMTLPLRTHPRTWWCFSAYFAFFFFFAGPILFALPFRAGVSLADCTFAGFVRTDFSVLFFVGSLVGCAVFASTGAVAGSPGAGCVVRVSWLARAASAFLRASADAKRASRKARIWSRRNEGCLLTQCCRVGSRRAAACGLGIVVEMVPLAGLEPARCFHHLILSQARLPIPPQGLEPRIIPTATQESTARAGFMWHIRAMALAGS